MYQAKNECVHDGIKNICGVGEIDGYRITGETLQVGLDNGCGINMEYATGWVAKKVTSHQIVYCIAYHSVNIMVETRWLRSANSGFLMKPAALRLKRG